MTNIELVLETIYNLGEVNDALYYFCRNDILSASETLFLLSMLKNTIDYKNEIENNLNKKLNRKTESI